ncbi:MAG TPA: hypothetical protein VKE94_11690, partial [Gemmataceae bacterium]|nr:hypothetical protein [Gemmataceae bacterium]
TTRVLRHCLDVDLGLVAVEEPAARSGQSLPHDVVVRQRGENGQEMATSLAFLASDDGRTAVACLKRLILAAPVPDRQFLVTDERCGLSVGNKGREYLEQLRQRPTPRFHHVELTRDDLAELDALAAVVGLAQSRDFEIEGPGGLTRTVSTEEVIESLQRQGRYRTAPLLREFVTVPESPS